MAMTREKAKELVDRFGSAAWGTGYYCHKDRVDLAAATVARDSLRPQLIDALCADPNAELLEVCKRLYDICFPLTVGQVIELGDDAAVAAGLYDAWKSCRYEPLLPLDLEWASAAIAVAEEG